MFRLTCLGSTGLSHANGDAVAIAGRQSKRMALLGYLALARPRGAHRRDTLIALLWPELDQQRARAALRQALHALRSTLGADTLRSDGTECVGVDRSRVTCDLWELEDAAAAGRHDEVLERYTGAPFDGLFVHDAPEFEQWLDGERARIRQLVCDSAWSLAEHARDTRETSAVAQYVKAALAQAPFDEGALRRAMSLLDAVGDRAGVVSLFREFAERLRTDLEATPSPETVALLEQLCQRTIGCAPANTDAPSIRVAAEIPVVPSTCVAVGLPIASTIGRVSGSTSRWRPLAVAAAALVTLGGAAQVAPTQDDLPDPRQVLVMPFVNASNASALNAVAGDIASGTRHALMQLTDVTVQSGENALRLTESIPSLPQMQSFTPGTIVRGTLRLVHDSLDIEAEVVDVHSRAVVRTVRADRLALADVQGGRGIDHVTDRIATAVATALYPGWGRALSAPPSLAAYQLFANAMRDITREQHETAASSLAHAYDMDSSFTAAGLVAAIEYYQLGRFQRADSLRRSIAARETTLPAVDRQLLIWLTQTLAGDRIGARAAMRSVVALEPRADLAWLQLAIDNVETDRPDEALVALDHIDATRDDHEAWAGLWATRIEALHLKRDHVRELAVARDGLRRHPELRVLANYELRALAALGRVEEIGLRLNGGPESMATGHDDGTSAVRQVALELTAHGYRAEGDSVLRSLLAWYDARPFAERTSVADRIGLARTYFLLNDVAHAKRMYDSISTAHVHCLDCLGVLGVLAARVGDRATAMHASDSLATLSRPFLFGRQDLWRARIAAVLGDTAGAARLLTAAFAAGNEFDVMTHADPDLRAASPEAVYRRFAFVVAER